MSKRTFPIVTVTLEKIVGGGQTIATMEDGRKLFVWGGLPGETVEVQLTRKKSKLAEGYVTNVITPSEHRIEALDPGSFMSTSPWQIMRFEDEQRAKAELIEEAFALSNVTLPNEIEVFTDGNEFGYRNKMEFSWYWTKETQSLDLAFFGRGTHSKITVEGSHLALPRINETALAVRDLMRAYNVPGFSIKTLLLRANQRGDVSAQLYVKDEKFTAIQAVDIEALRVQGLEVIFSNPKSPASVITKKLQTWGVMPLTDTLKDVEFSYATESFFQINLPVYEQALTDMQQYVEASKPTVDLYSGVGTIGLTIGTGDVTLVEINEGAVREMKANIDRLKLRNAQAVHAPSEKALEFITGDVDVVVDPPRAGLDKAVVERLLETTPSRIIYLSCNPSTQARDVALLEEKYKITAHRGYNFFPRTPHIENLVVLDLK
jgi:23S rRNA (uracil1939-C5)-methyltransferase